MHQRKVFPTLALVLLAGLALPGSGHAASSTLTVATPAAGAVSVSYAVVRTRGPARAPRLALASRSGVPSGATVVGGVRRAGRGRYLAALAVARPAGASASAARAATRALRVRIKARGGTRIAGVSGRRAASDVVGRRAPKAFCGGLKRGFDVGGTRLLAGTGIPGYGARAVLRNALRMGCGDLSGRQAFIDALRSSGEDEAGSGSGEVPPECREDPSICDPEDGPAKSTTLTGSGTVTRDASDPNLYRYSMQFNEPVRGFVVDGGGQVECPSESYGPAYAKCQGMGDSLRPAAGGTDVLCAGGEFTSQFACRVQGGRQPGRPAPTIPANTTITGSFSLSYGTAEAGEVTVTGEAANGGEAATPFALAGPG